MHRTHKITLGIIALIAMVSALLLTLVKPEQSLSVTGDSCAGAIINAYVYPTSTTTAPSVLQGLIGFKISIPSTQQISEIKMYAKYINTTGGTTTPVTTPEPILIGRAQPAGNSAATTGVSYWDYVWDTSLWKRTDTANYMVSVSADITLAGTTTACSIAYPTNFYATYNTTSPTLTLIASPSSFNNFINSSQTFYIAGSISTVSSTTGIIDYVNKYGYIKWQTANNNIGGVNTSSTEFLNNNTLVYNSGTVAGENKITAMIYYGGSIAYVNIPITVNKPIELAQQTTPTTKTSDSSTNSGTSTPTDSSTTPTTTAKDTTVPTTTSELTPTTQVTSSQLQISEVTKTCIEESLTIDRYNSIENGAVRPTTEELAKISNCFATSKYIMPTAFSPIDPLKVDKLAVETTATVSEMKNVTKTDSAGTQKQTIKIIGKAAPKTVVILYIFSDPIIITTTTDENGNWQYTLEDPLIPGKHEVYTVVNKGDGTYKRSDPMSFLIGTVAATNDNKNGLGLTIVGTPTVTPTESGIGLIYYIAGSAAAVLITLGTIFLIVKIHNKRKMKKMLAGNIPVSHEMFVDPNANVDKKETSLISDISSYSTPTINQIQSDVMIVPQATEQKDDDVKS